MCYFCCPSVTCGLEIIIDSYHNNDNNYKQQQQQWIDTFAIIKEALENPVRAF